MSPGCGVQVAATSNSRPNPYPYPCRNPYTCPNHPTPTPTLTLTLTLTLPLTKFISVLLVTLSTMVQLEMPQINLLSKARYLVITPCSLQGTLPSYHPM